MHLSLGEGLVSILAVLFPKQSHAAISLGQPAPEFEQILAKLGVVLANLSAGQRHTAALQGASGGQNRDFSAMDGGELLESLKALREYGEEASPALRLIEALSQWIERQPESPPGTVESPGIDDSKAEEVALPGYKVQAVAEDTKAILSDWEAQLWPFLPFEAVRAETNDSAQDTSSDAELKPALGLVSRFKDVATEAESLRFADTRAAVNAGLVSESAFPGGSPQPDILVPDGSPKQDPQVGQIGLGSPSHGVELLSSLTSGKVVGSSPTLPLVPQSGDKTKTGLELKSPLTSPEWADELGQRLIWMHGKSIQAAEIHLNPPQLGQVAVRIQMHDDQTSIQFASPHAAVREAIEAALPRLKELFNAQQLSLTQVEVAQQFLEDRSQARQEQSFASARDYQASAQEDGLEESGKESRRLEVNVGSRLLSLYV